MSKDKVTNSSYSQKAQFPLAPLSKWKGLCESPDGENISCVIVIKQSCFQVCLLERTHSLLMRSVCVCEMSAPGGHGPCGAARGV